MPPCGAIFMGGEMVRETEYRLYKNALHRELSFIHKVISGELNATSEQYSDAVDYLGYIQWEFRDRGRRQNF